MIDWAEKLLIYKTNVLPSLLEKLSQQLHVSTDALTALEIGYALRVPLKDNREFQNCWVIPERDETGLIIGLSLRLWNGDKRMIPGSKRGLIYVPNIHRSSTGSDKYQAGPHNWTRTTEEILCPICGKPDWCMVSAEEPEDPKAVLCCRIGDGASRNLGTAGYLHIRKPEGEVSTSGSILQSSEYPVIIVEGFTDVAAALDLGLIAIGRPSSSGRLNLLPKLLAGQDVIIMGENDAGAGKEGMEQTFEILQPIVKSITKLLPPTGIKDFRQWVIQGLSREQFLQTTEHSGDSTNKQLILASIAPLDLAKQWLDNTYLQDGIYTLRIFNGIWYAYNGDCYIEMPKTQLRKELYQYFGNRQFKQLVKNGYDILNYDPTKHKIDQIIDALLAFCPISSEEIPCWLSDKYIRIDPKQVLVFPNGQLHVREYVKQKLLAIHEKSSHLFTLSCYPYDFNPALKCQRWLEFLAELFTEDPQKIALLQEWFGYNLIADNSQEKFMLLLGPTRAGKSTILDILTYVLGPDQVLATSFKDYTRRFGLYPFLGKLAATIGDVSIGLNYDATTALNLLKRITGNDAITIERKGQDITQSCIKLYTRFTMAANIVPYLPDFARTIEARMLVLQFTRSFAGREDIHLKEKLKREAPGILLWALDGLRRLQLNGTFTLPLHHGNALRQVRGEMTPFTDFISDYCTLGDTKDYYVYCDNLYEAWKHWAIKYGERPYTIRWLSRSLTHLYSSCYRIRRLIKGQRRWVFTGIKLRREFADQFGVG